MHATAQVQLSGSGPGDSLYLEAVRQVQSGRADSAILTLQEAAGIYPDDKRFTRALAARYFDIGNYVDAGIMYRDMAGADSSDLSSFLRLAEMASFGQHYAKAMALLEHVLVIDSTNLSGLLLAGEVLTRMENTAAVVYYERAWQVYPGNQKVAYALANTYVQHKKPAQAIPVCERVLRDDSTSIRFQKLLGYACYKANQPHAAIPSFEKAVILGDSTQFTMKFKGLCHFMTMDMEGAIECLGHSLARDSMDAEVHFFFGAGLATTTRKTEAMFHLDEALRLMRPDPAVSARIYSEQGNLLRLEERYEEAYERYQCAWEADSTNPLALYYMASILDNSLHRSKPALIEYKRYIEALNSLPGSRSGKKQALNIRSIVEDRIESLTEELFFRDEELPE